MKVYLAKLERNGHAMYKLGHTKWLNSIKRFDDPQYDAFKVTILDDINIQHSDGTTARTMSKLVENTLHAIFPKNFTLEEHFGDELGTFDGLSGITECFILDSMSEEELVETFRRVKRQVGFALK